MVKKTRTVEESVTVLKRAIHLLGSTIIIISPGVFNLQVLGLPASQAGYESRTPHWHIATPWYNVRRLDHLHLVFNSPPRDFMELKKKKKDSSEQEVCVCRCVCMHLSVCTCVCSTSMSQVIRAGISQQEFM